MTSEEIKKIAQEYIDYSYPICIYPSVCLRDDFASESREEVTKFLQWFTQRYCIVPKSKVKEECDFWRQRLPKKYNLASEVNNNPDTARMWGKIEVLDDLFGKDTFEEEGK